MPTATIDAEPERNVQICSVPHVRRNARTPGLRGRRGIALDSKSGRGTRAGRGTRNGYGSRGEHGCEGTSTGRRSKQICVFNSSTCLRDFFDSVRVGLKKAADKWVEKTNKELLIMVENNLKS